MTRGPGDNRRGDVATVMRRAFSIAMTAWAASVPMPVRRRYSNGLRTTASERAPVIF